MPTTCMVPGCVALASRFGRYCTSHKSNWRRHGAADQRAVTKTELAPFSLLVQASIAANADNALWGLCEGRWRAVEDHAKAVLAEFRGGRAGSRSERVAAQEIVKLAEAVTAREVVVAVMGMFMLLHDCPRRFVTDNAFRVQLVRRVRGLTEVNAGAWTDATTGKRKLAYRELTPRAALIMGQWIADAFGGAAVGFARKEQEKRDAKAAERQALATALRELR